MSERISNLSVIPHKIEPIGLEVYYPQGMGHYIVIYFESGVEFSYDMEHFYHINPHSVVVFSPNSPQRYKSKAEKLLNSFVIFDTEASFFEEWSFPFNKIFYIGEETGNSVYALFDRLSFLNNTEIEKENRVFNELILKDVFGLIDRAYNDKKLQARCDNKRKRKLYEMRKDMYENPVKYQVHKMAENLFYTEAYFSVLYKKEFGISPVQDRKKAMVGAIKKLLLSTDYTLEKIAETLNILSVPYLIKLFKDSEGCTPQEYKRKIAKE